MTTAHPTSTIRTACTLHMPHTFGAKTEVGRHTLLGAAIGAVLLLGACTEDVVVDTRNAFPMGHADKFDQPVPTKLLFGQPVMTEKDYMPVALADIREPLPPLVPLPTAKDVEAAPSNTGSREDGGAVNPAAGQAAAISDGQGEGGKHELGASK